MFIVFCAGNKYVFWAKTEEEASMRYYSIRVVVAKANKQVAS
jgi:hypothetical protein